MSRIPRIVLAAVIVSLMQIGFVAWMIAGRAAVLNSGTDVTLTVEPIDPRDLLRGDYVVLSYPISVLTGEMAPEGAQRGDTIHVRVAPDADGVYRPVAASLGGGIGTPPAEGEVDIRGIVRNATSGRVHALFGIERFYVPEGKGRGIEENMRQDRFEVVVAVGEDGSAQIRSLLHDGQAIYSEPIF